MVRGVLVVSWNVNGIRARTGAVVSFIARHEPDVLCLQETKVKDGEFPFPELARLGYGACVAGQAAYNGVAIAARHPLHDVKIGLVDDGASAERRFIAATVQGVRILDVYVPNGKSVALPSFIEKLRFLERLRLTLDVSEDAAKALVLCGDFNVARSDRDVFDPARLRGQLLFHPDEQRALARVLDFGLVDAFRERYPEARCYSWWDYRGGDFESDRGLRIDYVFLTRSLAARVKRAAIDVEPRRLPKPSDHAPVLVELD
jgi:exodeoxyribonuclease-3